MGKAKADATADVSGTVKAIADGIQAMTTKNQTMKDGPPETGDQEQDSGQTRTHPTGEEKQAAYEKYKETIAEIWDQDMGAVDRAQAIGQAISDLAMEGGPDALKLLGDLVSK